MRIAFKMWVNPHDITKYEQRHNPIWKDLEQTLFAHGVTSYSIFLDADDGSLLGYAEIESRAQWDAIAETDVCKRWWKHMKDLMPTNPDNSPKSKELREVFSIRRPD